MARTESPAGYYPLYFFLTRSEARPLLKVMDHPSRTSAGIQRSAQELVFQRLKAQGWDPTQKGAPLVPFSQELQGTLAWGEWAWGGKHVYHFAPELTRAFLNSDCGEMRIEDVPPRTRSMYFHFGPQPSPELSWGEGRYHFEGAYLVYDAAESLRIVLCSRAAEGAPPLEAWQARYDLRVLASQFALPADEAIDLALEADLADIQIAIDKMWARGESAHAEESVQLAERMRRDHSAFRTALRLVLNALAYMEVEPTDVLPCWPANPPERLFAQLFSPSPKARARVEDKLWSLGYSPVYYIGQAFADAAGSSGEDHSHGSPKVHWRRGFWRRQAHGPQYSLRKLLWIRPTMVGA